MAAVNPFDQFDDIDSPAATETPQRAEKTDAPTTDNPFNQFDDETVKSPFGTGISAPSKDRKITTIKKDTGGLLNPFSDNFFVWAAARLVDEPKKAFSRSFVGSFGQLLKSYAIDYEDIKYKPLDIFGRIDRGEITKENVDEKVYQRSFQNIALIGAGSEYGFRDYTRYLNATPEERKKIKMQYVSRMRDPRKNMVYIAGDAIENWINETLPQSEDSKTFMLNDVPEALGSAAFFIVGTMIGKRPLGSLKLNKAIGYTIGKKGIRRKYSKLRYVESGLPAGYLGAQLEAANQFEDALRNGADFQTAFDAANYAKIGGWTEAVPLATLLSRVDRATKGRLKKIFVNMLIQGAEEGAQEFVQQFWSNLVASKLLKYDPKRNLWVGAQHGAEVGFTTGVIMEFLLGMIGRSKRFRGRIRPYSESRKEAVDSEKKRDAFAKKEGQFTEGGAFKAEDVIGAAPEAGVPTDTQTTETEKPGATEGAEPKTTYFDVRLKRPMYRDALTSTASETVKGGGKTFTSAYEAADLVGKPITEVTPIITGSINPEIIQSIIKNEGVGQRDIKTAIFKALSGEKLGTRQERIVRTILDDVTDARIEEAYILRGQRAAKKERLFSDASRLEEITSLVEQAQQAGIDEDEIIDIAERQAPDALVEEELAELLRSHNVEPITSTPLPTIVDGKLDTGEIGQEQLLSGLPGGELPDVTEKTKEVKTPTPAKAELAIPSEKERKAKTATTKEKEPTPKEKAKPKGKLAEKGKPTKKTEPFFSKTATVGKGIGIDGVKKAIAPIIGKWPDTAPQVVVIAETTDLSQRIQDEIGEGKPVDGVYDKQTKTVYLVAENIKTAAQARWVLAHEAVGHFGMEEMLGDEYQPVLDGVQQLKKGKGRVSKIADEVRSRYGPLDPNTESQEIIAVMAEKGVRNSLMKRIVAAIRRFLRSLGFTTPFTTTEIEAMIVQAGKFDRQGRAAPSQVAPEGQPFFSKQELADRVDALLRGEVISEHPLYLGETPKILQRLGMKPLPTAIKESNADKSIYIHGVTAAEMKALADAIADPVAVVDSKAQNAPAGALIVITDMVKSDGRPIIIAIHPDQTVERVTTNEIKSVYPKDNLEVVNKWLKQELRYVNNEKRPEWQRSVGVQFPSEMPKRDVTQKIVLTDRDIVKADRVASWGKNPFGRDAAPKGQPLFSRTPAEESPGIIGKMVKAGQPLDRIARIPFHVIGSIDEHGVWKPPAAMKAAGGAVTAAIDKAAESIYEKMPWTKALVENVKVGMIDNYGLPEDYRVRNKLMESEERKLLFKAKDFINEMRHRGMDSKEAAILHKVLTGEQVENEEWSGLAIEIRQAIDEMGQEAVLLGFIKQEDYLKNKGAYLHRVYMKHEGQKNSLGVWVSNIMAGRRKKLYGNEFKARGMEQEVTMDKLLQLTPQDWWGRKRKIGAADKALHGTKFYILDRMSVLTGEAKGKKPKLLERIYWPADNPVPTKYKGWENRGVWEVRREKGNKITLWRDFTKEERENMGEILDARYVVAKTFMLLGHDLAIGRFYRDIAANDSWTLSHEPDAETEGKWGNPRHIGATYTDVEWVKVPDTKIPKATARKWGELAGKWVRVEIWRDLNELDRINSPGVWRKIMTQWKTNKALALDTPIPTLNGWTTMGDIQIGDIVFDEQGKPCTVLEVKDIQHGRPCYEVCFSDGTSIIADEDHWWFVTGRNNSGGKVLTTKQILDTLTEPTRGDRNHGIPVSGALNIPDVELPINPYALGYWLGDGSSDSPRITVSEEDSDEIIRNLSSCGFYFGKKRKDKRSSACTFTMDTQPVTRNSSANLFNESLKDSGLIHNKHIPPVYLRASIDQRYSLLQGLIDSDGWVTEIGECGFATSNKVLRDGMIELLRSLGYKPTSSEHLPPIGNIAWRVHLQAYADKPITRIGRKASRLRERPSRNQRSSTRQIISVTPVPSVSVRCIAVSSKSHLYLAGEAMIPTHNTARSPVVHMNNVMSNLLFMDMADIRMRDLYVGIKEWMKKGEHYQDAAEHNAFGGSFAEHELRREVLEPILREVEAEMREDARSATQDGVDINAGSMWDLLNKIYRAVRRADNAMVDLYQIEDEVFRMATYMRRIELGDDPATAAMTARDQFLDYNIRAPWVVLARNTVLPFIGYSYRAVPVIAKSLAQRPWKVAKYVTISYLVNALGYMMSPGDEDKERRSMREELQGRTWLGTPRMIRMPWRDDYGNPVFLDVRRWIPAGDVFDVNQGQLGFIPAPLQFGGPLMMGTEFLLNKVAFTGRPIFNKDTDTGMEQATKTADWFWKSWMPSAPWIPKGWYWNKIGNAMKGARDPTGRPYSIGQAALSSVGVKLQPHDVNLGLMQHTRRFERTRRDLKYQLGVNQRDYSSGKKSWKEYNKEKQTLIGKMKRLTSKASKTLGE